jgi:hypothetical protein
MRSHSQTALPEGCAKRVSMSMSPMTALPVWIRRVTPMST